VTAPNRAAEAVSGRGQAADPGGVVDELRSRAAFTAAPTSSRLPFSYQRIPQRVRTSVGGVIGRVRRRQVDSWARYPTWPLDLSADAVADLLGVPTHRFERPTPVVLTHDLDTAEGLRNAVSLFAPIEQAVGAACTHYVVPCGWSLDHGLLGELADRGHELGIHGYDHSNRTPYAPDAERRARLDSSLELAARYGMTGYRAPSLCRTPELLTDLASRFGYDSSIPTSGGLFPTPNNGCATARPYLTHGLVEVPLSLPRDGSLRFLGYQPDEILATWRACTADVARSGGVVVLLTHCEERFSGNAAMLRVYRQFLEEIAADPSYRFTRAQDIVADVLGSHP
jgi:peptidoglycan/xylan/chitin deacetylase (PgdA/CDA1 family)